MKQFKDTRVAIGCHWLPHPSVVSATGHHWRRWAEPVEGDQHWRPSQRLVAVVSQRCWAHWLPKNGLCLNRHARVLVLAHDWHSQEKSTCKYLFNFIYFYWTAWYRTLAGTRMTVRITTYDSPWCIRRLMSSATESDVEMENLNCHRILSKVHQALSQVEETKADEWSNRQSLNKRD